MIITYSTIIYHSTATLLIKNTIINGALINIKKIYINIIGGDKYNNNNNKFEIIIIITQ